jgi:hypothetical protein
MLSVVCGGLLITPAIWARGYSAVNADRQMYNLWCLWVFSLFPLALVSESYQTLGEIYALTQAINGI